MLEVVAITIRQVKGIKQIHIGEEEVKVLLFANDIIVYTINPRKSTRKLLQLKNTFSEVAGYKINSKKSVSFLYKQ